MRSMLSRCKSPPNLKTALWGSERWQRVKGQEMMSQKMGSDIWVQRTLLFEATSVFGKMCTGSFIQRTFRKATNEAKVNAGHPRPLAGALVKVDRSKNLDHSQIRLFHSLDGRANRKKTEWPNLPGVLELPLILFSLGFRAFALLRGRLFFFSLTLSLSLTFGLLVLPCLE